jgi:hypothetical protein
MRHAYLVFWLTLPWYGQSGTTVIPLMCSLS